MARSNASTPEAYLVELEPARAAEIARVRDAVNAAMPDGFEERMAWGMISWDVPLEVSGPTYNKQPLVYAALAAQKNYNALHLNGIYVSEERSRRLVQAFANAGLKLDMGKSCIRFRKADDLAMDAVAREIGSMTPREFAALAPAPR
ncbi:MAG TPA: DUF1801 domain-containing protein [Sphingomicrobium sp.]|nr:DUF1801 domain-containing protein [Sphingomicrobium sp.]